MQNTIGVDVEHDFDLRHAARRGRNPFQVELAEGFVARRHIALALQHVNRHRRLIVVRGGKHLLGLGRDGGVFLDQLSHHAAQRFNAERQRCYIEQQHIFHIALQNAALHRRADGNRFVRIHIFTWFLTKKLAHFIDHFWHACHTADQDYVLNVGDFHAGIFDRDAARLDGALDQFVHQAFELGAGNLHRQVPRPVLIRRDIGQIDFRLLRRGQFDLGFLRRFFQPLQREHVFGQIDALILFEFRDDVVDQALVEIFTAQEGIAVSRQYFELMFLVDFSDIDNGNIERAAA